MSASSYLQTGDSQYYSFGYEHSVDSLPNDKFSLSASSSLVTQELGTLFNTSLDLNTQTQNVSYFLESVQLSGE